MNYVTHHDLATVAVRLLAVFVLTMLDGTVASLMTHYLLGAMFTHVLFQIGFAAMLWLLAPVIARLLLQAPDRPGRLAPDLSLVTTVGHGVLGLALAMQAVALFVQAHAMYGAVDPRNIPQVPDARIAFTIAAVQFVGAAALFLGRRGIRSLVDAVRSY